MITENDLLAAAATIRTMPDTLLNQRLNGLIGVRREQTRYEIVRHGSDIEAAQLDEAAYQLARQYQATGELLAAGHWYRVAALNDYADAALQLGSVLEQLAEQYLDTPVAPGNDELNLVIEAAHWYNEAVDAGYFDEATERFDALISRHDPARVRPSSMSPLPNMPIGDWRGEPCSAESHKCA